MKRRGWGFFVREHPAFGEASKQHVNSYHGGPFAQDYFDAEGRLIHAEWDGTCWQLQDANTGEFLGLHDDRQLPDRNTFRPPNDARPQDVHHNDQLLAKLRGLDL